MIRKSLKYPLTATCILASLGFGYHYWRTIILYPDTDDAYIKANVVQISPNLSGPITQVYVQDNQFVKKGTLLFTIDSRPYDIALAQAKANLDIVKKQIQGLKDAVVSAKAKVNQAQAQLALDKKNTLRTETLVKDGRAALATGDKMAAQLKVSQASLEAAISEYNRAVVNLGKPGKDNANLRQAIAQVRQAKLNLEYTHIKAPADGKVCQFQLRVGNTVHAGQPVFSLIEQNDYWVEANFKETQLERIKVGQPVTISLDMYPAVTFNGTVTSISGGTGSSFSILPQENATGNWVKVTQRIPVRVGLKDIFLPLPIGASATVTIDTTHG